MKVSPPQMPWTGYMALAGEFISKVNWADGTRRTLTMCAIVDNAPDEVKTQYEVYRNGLHNMKDVAPELEDPYYTWEGKVVERSSLAGRKLPLAPKKP